jgi:hypothetical protein
MAKIEKKKPNFEELPYNFQVENQKSVLPDSSPCPKVTPRRKWKDTVKEQKKCLVNLKKGQF